MGIKVLKEFSGRKSESVAAVAARLRARNRARARAEALAKAKAKAKAAQRNEGDEQVDDINIDADTAQVLYADKDANYQVVVGEDTSEGGIAVVVATAAHDNLEDEEVIAAITVGEGESPAEASGAGEGAGEGANTETEEAKKAAEAAAKAKAIEEARTAIKARLKK